MKMFEKVKNWLIKRLISDPTKCPFYEDCEQDFMDGLDIWEYSDYREDGY